MDIVARALSYLETLRNDPAMIGFVADNLLRTVVVGLAFGFAILLIEIRLPLRYYWDLPVFLFKDFLADFRVVKRSPAWGLCMDGTTHKILPVAAVEQVESYA